MTAHGDDDRRPQKRIKTHGKGKGKRAEEKPSFTVPTKPAARVIEVPKEKSAILKGQQPKVATRDTRGQPKPPPKPIEVTKGETVLIGRKAPEAHSVPHSIAISSGTKIQSAVRKVINGFASSGLDGRGVVILQCKAAHMSKMITVVETAKRAFESEASKEVPVLWYQYTILLDAKTRLAFSEDGSGNGLKILPDLDETARAFGAKIAAKRPRKKNLPATAKAKYGDAVVEEGITEEEDAFESMATVGKDGIEIRGEHVERDGTNLAIILSPVSIPIAARLFGYVSSV